MEIDNQIDCADCTVLHGLQAVTGVRISMQIPARTVKAMNRACNYAITGVVCFVLGIVAGMQVDGQQNQDKQNVFSGLPVSKSESERLQIEFGKRLITNAETRLHATKKNTP